MRGGRIPLFRPRDKTRNSSKPTESVPWWAGGFHAMVLGTRICQRGLCGVLLRVHLGGEHLEEIGEQNVVQVVTGNASSYKAQGKLLMAKRKHLYWTPHAAHCIDLMLEDIGRIQRKKTVDVASKLSRENLTWSFRRVPRSGVEQDQLTDLTTYVEGVCSLGVTPDRNGIRTLDGSCEFSVASAKRLLNDNSFRQVYSNSMDKSGANQG
ncbi:hypothetical protein Tco_0074017 [Tanacetum coccineum]